MFVGLETIFIRTGYSVKEIQLLFGIALNKEQRYFFKKRYYCIISTALPTQDTVINASTAKHVRSKIKEVSKKKRRNVNL